MVANPNVPQQLTSHNFPAAITPRHGVVTLFGYGIQVSVDHGHLILEDGIGASRRFGRFSRVRHGLHRVIVIGSEGCVSFAALRWLAHQNVAFVMLNRDGTVLATTTTARLHDARLRRAQAVAAQSGVALRIARALIAAKLMGQECIARERLNNPQVAETITAARIGLEEATTMAVIRGLEARAGLAYWSAWRDIAVIFPKVDLKCVPEHWRSFGTRVSPISGSPRCAFNPPNAVLNYLYAVLESESRLALATVGLDPGLGVLHVDSRSRDSLACDLMETVRPEVDSYVLDWLTNRLFQRKQFFEMTDGTCRLMAELCTQLSRTANAWAHAVAPWAEFVARTLSTTLRKSGNEPATPLTGDHRRAGRAGKHIRPVVVPPKPSRACKTCGRGCENLYCASCGRARTREAFAEGRIVAQNPEALARRSATQKAHVHANRAWKPSNELTWLSREVYIKEIQPRLRTLKISHLQSALGVSEPYAAFIRSGSCIPHQRHWRALAKLVCFPNRRPDKDHC